MMTRKNYQEIADAIKANVSYDDNGIPERIAYDLIPIFKRDNSRFDSYKFLKACGVAD
jgi:hypothetical protein